MHGTGCNLGEVPLEGPGARLGPVYKGAMHATGPVHVTPDGIEDRGAEPGNLAITKKK